jgi:hypothetical protein
MRMIAKILLLLAIVSFPWASAPQNAPAQSSAPAYTSDAQLKFPADYRNWIYLTSGFDMSYTANDRTGEHHQFDNVFVNPESYKAFLATGTWPDKTMLVLEVREAQSKGSINQQGNFLAPADRQEQGNVERRLPERDCRRRRKVVFHIRAPFNIW